MKHLSLIFCLILCSCPFEEEEQIIGECPPIILTDLSFSAEEGIDSILVYP